MQKTIFITIFDGLISKNILGSGVLNEIIRHDVRVVLLVRPNKVEYFTDRFGSPRVIVEPIPVTQYPRIEAWLSALSLILTQTPTALFRLKTNLLSSRRIHWYLIARLLRPLGAFRFVHRCVALLFYCIPDTSFDRLIGKYRPDAFFVPNLMSSEDRRLMSVAKKRHIVCIGMVKSWDNAGGRPYVFLHADALIAQSEIVKQDAVELLHVDPERIIVTGFPQYDTYVDERLRETRERYCERVGIDPRKQIILFAATGAPWTPNEIDIFQGLEDAIESGEIPNAIVVVRFHPKYPSPEVEVRGMRHLMADRPGTYRDMTKLASWEFEEGDVRHLINSLYHASVCINTGSTMALESILFDKPTIGIAFDGNQHLPEHRSVRRFYKFRHNAILVGLGGEELAYSMGDLIAAINRSLSEPSYRSEGRRVTREKELFKLDGKASERVARVITDALLRIEKMV